MAIRTKVLLLGLLLGVIPLGPLLPSARAEGISVPSDLLECAKLFDPVGVPDGRDDADERDYFYANGMKPSEPSEEGRPSPVLYKCYGTGFAIRLNAVTRVPDWVAEDITREEIEIAAERSNRFFVDETVKDYSSTLEDYRSSGFDRGHQAPSGDFSADQAMQDQTFVMSNRGRRSERVSIAESGRNSKLRYAIWSRPASG